MTNLSPDLTPLILVVDDQEANARALESILRPKGHVVLKAYTGQQALDLSAKVSPDAILLDLHLPDADGIDLIRRMKESATVHETTPILITTDATLGKADRIEALGAGAWDILEHPVDAPELILRLDTFVRAKQETDRVRDEGLTDPSTGFYNIRGVLKRAKELSADAARSERPLTCIAFGADLAVHGTNGDSARSGASLASAVSEALRKVTRVSDTVGQMGDGEFVVVAPGTNNDGAVRLADRVLEALQEQPSLDPSMIAQAASTIRAGVYSIDGSADASAEDLLLRATMALRRAQQDDRSFRVRAYDA